MVHIKSSTVLSGVEVYVAPLEHGLAAVADAKATPFSLRAVLVRGVVLPSLFLVEFIAQVPIRVSACDIQALELDHWMADDYSVQSLHGLDVQDSAHPTAPLRIEHHRPGLCRLEGDVPIDAKR